VGRLGRPVNDRRSVVDYTRVEGALGGHGALLIGRYEGLRSASLPPAYPDLGETSARCSIATLFRHQKPPYKKLLSRPASSSSSWSAAAHGTLVDLGRLARGDRERAVPELVWALVRARSVVVMGRRGVAARFAD
jgi:hypothetical protein